MSLITVFKVSFLLMRTKVELCVSCTVLARSHSESEQKVWKILPREDSFWCSLLGKNHSWWSALLQHACCSKIHPQHNTWHGRFVSLITLIHITKLDYCMQYKSFVILGHAYFLNPYIQVARRLLAYKRWSTPHRERYRVAWMEMMAVQVSTQKVLSKQASPSFASALQPKNETACVCQGSLAPLQNKKRRKQRYRKWNLEHLPGTDRFTLILVLVFKSGEVKVLTRATTLLRFCVWFQLCCDPKYKTPLQIGD